MNFVAYPELCGNFVVLPSPRSGLPTADKGEIPVCPCSRRGQAGEIFSKLPSCLRVETHRQAVTSFIRRTLGEMLASRLIYI